MLKRTAVALLMLPCLAFAQQQVYWLPFWVMPPATQPMPFPTPFWLWRVPPVQPAAQPEVAQPEVAQPEAAQPEVAKPEVAKPEAAQPEVAKPVAAQPEAAKPEVAKPEAAQPVAAQPVAAQSEAAAPAAAVSLLPAVVTRSALPAISPVPTQPVLPVQQSLDNNPVQLTTVPVKAMPRQFRVRAKPAPARKAARKIVKKVVKKLAEPRAAHPPRKLCFKGGKLDICP